MCKVHAYFRCQILGNTCEIYNTIPFISCVEVTYFWDLWLTGCSNWESGESENRLRYVFSRMAVLRGLQPNNRGGSPSCVCAYDTEHFLKVFHQNVDVLQRHSDQQSRVVKCAPSPLLSCLSVDESLTRRHSAFVMFRSAPMVCQYTAHYWSCLSYYGTLVCSCKRRVKSFPFLVATV